MKNIMCTKKGDKSGRVIKRISVLKTKRQFENLNNIELRKSSEVKEARPILIKW